MFASIRRYRMDMGSVSQLTRRVDAGFAELIVEQPGFISYELIDCNDSGLMTVSTFEHPEEAEASRSLARRFTAEMSDIQMHRIGGYHGVVWVGRASHDALTPGHGGPPFTFASIRRFDLRSGDVAMMMHLLDTVFAEKVSAIDGFRSYQALDCGAAGWFTVSLFRDQEGAEESDDLSLWFVREHLHGYGIERTEMLAGEVMVSRAMSSVLTPIHA
jgi:hypothetical protein